MYAQLNAAQTVKEILAAQAAIGQQTLIEGKKGSRIIAELVEAEIDASRYAEFADMFPVVAHASLSNGKMLVSFLD